MGRCRGQACRAGCRGQASGLPDLGGCLCAGEQQQAAGAKYVDVLAKEMNRKQHLYNDDLAFIREVKQGVVAAPGMNPDQELKTLRLRFDAFKKDFKVSCWWVLQACYCMYAETAVCQKTALAVFVPAEACQPASLHCWGVPAQWQKCWALKTAPESLLGHCRRDWQTPKTF